MGRSGHATRKGALTPAAREEPATLVLVVEDDDAVRLARELRPAVVLMDLMLPDTDGIEAASLLRGRREGGGDRSLILAGAGPEPALPQHTWTPGDMAGFPIDEMEPGRTLDELVATVVLGWTLERPCAGEPARMPGGWRCLKCGKTGAEGEPTAHPEVPPRTSTNIATAWKLLEGFARQGAEVAVSANVPDRGPEPWCATITALGTEHRAGGETAAVAICRAALKARGA